MKQITIVLIILILGWPVRLFCQDTVKKYSFYAPNHCFDVTYPDKVSLPDSLRKDVHTYLTLRMLYFFDSLGNILEFLPTELVMQSHLNATIKNFYFNMAIRKHSTIFTENEAMKYVKWADEKFRPLIKIYRYPMDSWCKEHVTNRNSFLLEVKLE